MTLPKLPVILRRLDDLEELLRSVREEMQWAHEIAYPSLRGTGEAKVQAGKSDPTGDDAVASQGARHQLAKAWKATGRALGALIDAENALLRITEPKDRGPERRRGFPLTVQPSELETARDAKRRREARGEGWGGG